MNTADLQARQERAERYLAHNKYRRPRYNRMETVMLTLGVCAVALGSIAVLLQAVVLWVTP